MLTHSHLCPSRLSSLALLSTFTHSTSPALLLVCTLSNCVSSHLVTLSSTLPSLACLRHTCTHTRACTHTCTHAQKEAHQPCWILFSKTGDLCTYFSHVIFCFCLFSQFICWRWPPLELSYGYCTWWPLWPHLWGMLPCHVMHWTERSSTTIQILNPSGIPRAGRFYFLYLRSGFILEGRYIAEGHL